MKIKNLIFLKKGEWLLLTDPTAASYLLATETYRPSPPTVALKLFFGPGALGCEGEISENWNRDQN